MATYTRNPDRDVWITDEFPAANWDGFALRSGVVAGPWVRRFLLYFDLDDFPDYLSIDAAQIEMPIIADGILDVAATLYRLTRTNWIETAATWNNYTALSAWTTPGGDYDVSTPTPRPFFQPRNPGKLIINQLAPFVRDAIDNRAGDLSVIGRQDSEGSVVGQYIYGDAEDGDPALHPLLRVEYTRPSEVTRVVDDRRVTIGATSPARGNRPAPASAPSRTARPARPG